MQNYLVDQSKLNVPLILSKPVTVSSSLSKKRSKTRYKGFFSHLFYPFLLASIISFIIAIKVLNYGKADWIVFSYTILITTFMLSRVVGSFFYRPYKDRLSLRHRARLDMGFSPSVSFVIPCKNEQDAIYGTIAACAESDYPAEKIEIIAINDGSTDNALNEMLRAKKDYPNTKIDIVNFEKNKGKRAGMVEGFTRAVGEIVIQVDSDSYPEKEALRNLILPFVDESVGATVGHTDPANKDENIMTKIQTAYYFMSFRALKATESIFDMVFCCSGCFSAYRRSYVMSVLNDFVEEKFLGKSISFGDDRALTNWMIRKGYKTVYVDNAQAYTVVPNTLRKFVKQQVRWKKGWLINSLKISATVIKKDAFVAFTYFIPLILITIVAPFIAIKALIINPIFLGISPWVYIGGIMLVSFLLLIHYKVYSDDKYGKYMLLYSILNMTILTYILLYALYDLRNMAWGTR